jgi:uncharacterized membrane protein HdeD (DUF308 family)
MTTVFALHWWVVALRGGAAVLFGLFALLRPGVALGALVLVFGIYALLDGLFAAVAGVRAAEHHQRWWPALLEAVLGVGAALAAFLVPTATVVGLLYAVAAWALISGGLKLAGAVHLGRHVSGAWWLAVAGVVSLVFGLLLLVAPGAGARALVWWVGVYALVRGTTLLVLALRLRRHHHRHRPGPPGSMGEPVAVT